MRYVVIFLIGLIVSLQTEAQSCRSVLMKLPNNEPVSGAQISNRQRQQRTVSDAHGYFSIVCNEGDTIRITHASVEPMLVIIGVNGLPAKIELQPASARLQEVEVNTGYQRLPKERATGSFENINNSLYNQQTGTNVLDRLESIANGLYIEKKTTPSTPRITIRGLSSIQGPREPLIIVDNFPYTGNLDNINPNDVESITILKDAAAASIWGTRAGNGVIVITTKKGKYNQPLKTEFNYNITVGDKPDLFLYNNISSSDYVDVEEYLYGKGYYNSALNSSSRPHISPGVEILAARANGSISAAEATARLNALRSQDLRRDFDKYVYNKSVNSQYAINLRGGSNNRAWILSAGYDDNRGTLDELYRRLNLRSENSIRLHRRIELTVGIAYTHAETAAGKTGYYNMVTSNGRLPVYTSFKDSSGNQLPVLKQFRQSYLDTAGGGKLLNWNYYPLEDYKYVDNSSSSHSLLFNAGINIKLLKGLDADLRYQYEMQQTDARVLNKEGSFYTRNLINSFSEINYSTGQVTYNVPRGGILTKTNEGLATNNARAQLNYNRRKGNHAVNAIAGAEVREVRNNSDTYRTYGYNDNTAGYGTVSYLNSYRNFITGFISYIPNEQNFDRRNNRFVSMFGNAAYTYKNRYTASASARRDASNLFGVNTNDKWTPLWSAGLAWDVSKENFYQWKKASFLKLRATYGISGNVDASRSGSTVLLYGINSTYTFIPTARIDQFSNPDLRWEKISMLNVGLDFRMLNERISGSVEYYYKRGKDLLGSSNVDYTAVATNSLIKNVASMTGSGWDIALNTINIQKKITWTSALNFNTNKDKVSKYLLSNRSASNFVGGSGISPLEGKPVYGLYVYRWGGLDSAGNPQSYLQGQLSTNYAAFTAASYPVDSLKYAGRSLPAVFGSFGNTVSYKGFSLTVRLSFKMGYYFLRNSIYYGNLFSSRQGHGDYALRWQKPGDEVITNVPSMVYPVQTQRDRLYNSSEALVEKGDHIRVQYITATYELKNVFKKLPVNQCNLYLNINNLGLLWSANKKGIDPDYREESFPPAKTIAIGVRTNF